MDRARARELSRVLLAWLAVVAGTLLVLAAFDAAPAVLGGEPRGVRAYSSIPEAERAVRSTLVLPAYFPAALAWPPASIRAYAGPPASVAVTFAPVPGRSEHLGVIQVVGPDSVVPAALQPASGALLQQAEVTVDGRPGRLRRIALDGGGIMHELSWTSGSSRVTYEWNGRIEDLLLMADSAERRRR